MQNMKTLCAGLDCRNEPFGTTTPGLRLDVRTEADAMSGRAAGGRRDDDPDWPRRIGFRPCDPRHRERGSARCEMQKISAGKFHCSPSAAVIRCERARIAYSCS